MFIFKSRIGSVALVIAMIVVIVLVVAGGLWYYEVHKAPALTQPLSAVYQGATQNATSTVATTSPAVIDSATSTNSTTAACDYSEVHENEIPDLSGGTAVSGSDQEAMLNNLFKMGFINSTSEIDSPMDFFGPNQTYFIIQSSTVQQMYRATTTDLVSGVATAIPLTSLKVFSGDETLWIRGYIDGTLLYSIEGQPSPYTLQAINSQSGQWLWSFSTSTDFNNVVVSGDGIFVDFFHKYYVPGFAKIDPLTGKILWESSIGMLPTIWNDGHLVYAIDNDNFPSSTLYELSDTTGAIVNKFPLPDNVNYNAIDECGGNLYLIQEALDNQNGEGPDDDYTRFNPQTGAIKDIGPVFGSP